MNIAQLLALEPERTDTINFALNEDLFSQGYCYADEEYPDRMALRVLKDHSYDGRRIWYLAIATFDNQPVAVIQRAGREGRDHKRLLVIDQALYREACAYLYLLSLEVPDPIDPLADVSCFCDQSIEQPFNKINLDRSGRS